MDGDTLLFVFVRSLSAAVSAKLLQTPCVYVSVKVFANNTIGACPQFFLQTRTQIKTSLIVCV